MAIPDSGSNKNKYEYLVNFCKGRTCANDELGGKNSVVSRCVYVCVHSTCACACVFTLSAQCPPSHFSVLGANIASFLKCSSHIGTILTFRIQREIVQLVVHSSDR